MTQQGDMTPQYPLGERQPERLRSHTGLPLEGITLEAVREGWIGSDDLTICAETLHTQAEIAAAAGYRQLAANLRRAAELVNVPNDRLLHVYEALRPHRSTYQALLALSEELATEHGATENARFVRQAANAYRDAELLRSEGD